MLTEDQFRDGRFPTDEPLVMMTDYSAPFPLWWGGGLAVNSLPLTVELVVRLLAWQTMFDRHFHWEQGWDAPGTEARFVRTAFEVLPLLRVELGPDVDVRLDLWPAGADLVTQLDPRFS